MVNPLASIPVDISNLVFCSIPATGTLKDFVNNISPTINGNCYWNKINNKYFINSDGSSGYLDYGDMSGISFSSGLSIFVSFYIRKSVPAGTHSLFGGNDNSLYFSVSYGVLKAITGDLADNEVAGSTSIGLNTVYTGAFIYATGGAKTLYLNGILDGTESTTGTISLPSNNYMLSSTGSSAFLNGGIGCCLIFNDALTENEVLLLDRWSKQRFSPTRKFTQIDFPKIVSGDELNLAAGWNLGDINNGTLCDLSSNGNDGSIGSGVSVIDTLVGKAAKFSGDSGAAVSCGNDSSIRPEDALTIIAVMKSNDAGNIELIDYIKSPTPTYSSLYSIRDDMVTVNVNDGSANGADISASFSQVISDSRWHHIGLVFSRAAQTLTPYIDGIAGTASSIGGDYPLDSSGVGVSILYLGCATPTLRNADMELHSLRLFSDAKSTNWMQSDYKKLASKVVFRESLSSAKISPVQEGGSINQTISNTEYKCGDSLGRFKIVDDNTIRGGRALLSMSSGIVYRENSQAYGTWDIELNPSSGVQYISFIADRIGADDDPVGYQLYLLGNGIIMFRRIIGGGSPAVLFTTAVGYFSSGTYYRIRVTRRYDGQFYLYIKGGIYNNWTLVSVNSGTNPITDNTYTTSKYFVFDVDNNTKISNDIQYFGVLAP